MLNRILMIGFLIATLFILFFELRNFIKVIDATMMLIIDNGYSGATTKEIAKGVYKFGLSGYNIGDEKQNYADEIVGFVKKEMIGDK